MQPPSRMLRVSHFGYEQADLWNPGASAFKTLLPYLIFTTKNEECAGANLKILFIAEQKVKSAARSSQKLQKLKRPEAEIRAKQPKNSLYRALLAAMAGVLKALEIPGGTAPGGVEAPKSARGLRAAYVAGTACGGHEVLGDELVCTVKDGAKSLE
jgi:hypothetical protein